MTPKSIPLKMKANKTRKHSSRMCTTHFPSSDAELPPLGCSPLPPDADPLPLDADPLPLDIDSLPLMQIPSSWMQTLSPLLDAAP